MPNGDVSGAPDLTPPPIGVASTSTERSACIVVMGVSGTGKSTLGHALAQALSMPYVEGDDLHPKSNVEKMSAGQPLSDADREPWLELIRATAEHKIVEQQQKAIGGTEPGGNFTGVVVTCSSLKKYYRDILRGKRKPASKGSNFERLPVFHEPADTHVLSTYFVFIEGSREVLLDRMEKRPGHFMKANMLDSQLSTLENPRDEEGVVVVSTEQSTQEQIQLAKQKLGKITVKGLREHIEKLKQEIEDS